MKKKILIYIMLACSFLFAFTGCKDEGEYEDVSEIKEEEKKTFSFEYNGKTVNIGEDWALVNKKLGDYESMFVSESCAYQGTDRFYYYKDFEIMTSEIDGKEILTNIYIDKENVKAVNGICLGMGLSEVAKNMGPADKSTEKALIYYGSNVNVQISLQNDKVIGVEYYYETQ
ncbi:MAG: hypothetical protein J6L69_01185 [Lachnospiraceae bacterium]|nr:hypothetical protein [Lachnospiraceae bacterium]